MISRIPDKSRLKRPLYQGLADAMAQCIEDGSVQAGSMLPTQRDLAARMNLSLQTVSKAYAELIQRGLVQGQIGRGTFVADPNDYNTPFMMEQSVGGLLDLSISRPVGGAVHVEYMRETLKSLGNTLGQDAVLVFRPSVGLPRHREAGALWLRDIGLEVDPSHIILTNGASPALTIALLTAARPGDVVATEQVTHHGIIPLASYLGMRLVGLPVDGQGILPEALETLCRVGSVKVLFTAPTLANPMGTMLPAARREQIAAIARRHRVMIVEDDVSGPLPEHRPPPIAAFAPELTFYITSLTKCVMPGLRVGYLVVPPGLMPSATSRQLSTTWMGTPLMGEIAERWIRQGIARELVAWQREALRARNAILQGVLGEHILPGHDHGLHRWLPLPAHWPELDFIAHARLLNVAVAPASPFHADGSSRQNAVRISLGTDHANEYLEQGLARLADLLTRENEPLAQTF